MKFAFICTGEKAVSAKSPQHFLDMAFMLCEVVRIDQDVVQIDNDIDVYHIRENVVHESLKSCGSVSKAFWHYQPLERSILSPESGFPFVSFGNAYKMIRVLEINFGVDSSFLWCVQQV